MNAKSFVFDVALPGIFVLGAGVATFMLSGGPEEYPSSEDEKEDQEELLVGESNDPDSELNTQNNENLIPKWAIEVIYIFTNRVLFSCILLVYILKPHLFILVS